MRKLSEMEIEKFASGLAVQGNIVKGILSGIGPASSTDIRDLFFTAKLQGWHKETIKAILSGIAHAATPAREEETPQPSRIPKSRRTPQQ